MAVQREAFVELRQLLERHRQSTDAMIDAALNWVNLAEQYLAVDARAVAAEYQAMRAKGSKHKNAVMHLALKYERTSKRIEQLIRTAATLDKLDRPQEPTP
jgi:hypothetical protein